MLSGGIHHLPWMPLLAPSMPLLLPLRLWLLFWSRFHYFFEVWWEACLLCGPCKDGCRFSIAELAVIPWTHSWFWRLTAPYDGEKKEWASEVIRSRFIFWHCHLLAVLSGKSRTGCQFSHLPCGINFTYLPGLWIKWDNACGISFKYAMPYRYWLELWSCLLKEEETGIRPF